MVTAVVPSPQDIARSQIIVQFSTHSIDEPEIAGYEWLKMNCWVALVDEMNVLDINNHDKLINNVAIWFLLRIWFKLCLRTFCRFEWLSML